MMGFPTETESDLKQTLDVACQSKLHAASFYTLTPFPNTKVYDIAMKNGALGGKLIGAGGGDF